MSDATPGMEKFAKALSIDPRCVAWYQARYKELKRELPQMGNYELSLILKEEFQGKPWEENDSSP